MKSTKTIGQRVAYARSLMGWNQTNLAEAVGVKAQTIQQIEDGSTKRSRYLPDIADACHIPFRWIVEGGKIDDYTKAQNSLLDEKDKSGTVACRLQELMNVHGHRNAADVAKAAKIAGIKLAQSAIQPILDNNTQDATFEKTCAALLTFYDITEAQIAGDAPLFPGVAESIPPYLTANTTQGGEIARIASEVLEILNRENVTHLFTPETIGKMIGFAYDNRGEKTTEESTSNIIDYEKFASAR